MVLDKYYIFDNIVNETYQTFSNSFRILCSRIFKNDIENAKN